MVLYFIWNSVPKYIMYFFSVYIDMYILWVYIVIIKILYLIFIRFLHMKTIGFLRNPHGDWDTNLTCGRSTWDPEDMPDIHNHDKQPGIPPTGWLTNVSYLLMSFIVLWTFEMVCIYDMGIKVGRFECTSKMIYACRMKVYYV